MAESLSRKPDLCCIRNWVSCQSGWNSLEREKKKINKPIPKFPKISAIFSLSQDGKRSRSLFQHLDSSIIIILTIIFTQPEGRIALPHLLRAFSRGRDPSLRPQLLQELRGQILGKPASFLPRLQRKILLVVGRSPSQLHPQQPGGDDLEGGREKTGTRSPVVSHPLGGIQVFLSGG